MKTHKILLNQGSMNIQEKWQYSLAAVQAKAALMLDPLMRLMDVNVNKAIGNIDLNAIVYPDSSFAKAALEEMETASTAAMSHHCHRSYIWASLLNQLDRNSVDAELLYVSCMLHDLGLTEKHHGRCKSAHCFTFDGVEAAHNVLSLTNGAKAECVSNAILNHLNVSVPGEKFGWETHYLQAGASLDVTGKRHSDIPNTIVHSIHEHYPRLTINSELMNWLDREVDLRPHSRFAVLRKLGFKGIIKNNPLARK